MAGVDPESTKTHVCLLGHSYIRRLAEFMTVNPNLQNLNLDDDRYNISVCARGGLRTYDLHRMIRDVTETSHMFFIQIGGNDIGFIPNKQIVTNIVSFAEYLIYGLGTRVVIIGQLLRRDPSANPPGYNESVTEVNDLLTQKTQTLSNIFYWRHRGFWLDMSHLGRDGVHLANPPLRSLKPGDPPSPMKKYWRSIRNAVIVHSPR